MPVAILVGWDGCRRVVGGRGERFVELGEECDVGLDLRPVELPGRVVEGEVDGRGLDVAGAGETSAKLGIGIGLWGWTSEVGDRRETVGVDEERMIPHYSTIVSDRP